MVTKLLRLMLVGCLTLGPIVHLQRPSNSLPSPNSQEILRTTFGRQEPSYTVCGLECNVVTRWCDHDSIYVNNDCDYKGCVDGEASGNACGVGYKYTGASYKFAQVSGEGNFKKAEVDPNEPVVLCRYRITCVTDTFYNNRGCTEALEYIDSPGYCDTTNPFPNGCTKCKAGAETDPLQHFSVHSSRCAWCAE